VQCSKQKASKRRSGASPISLPKQNDVGNSK
jgi:hypothetical protein